MIQPLSPAHRPTVARGGPLARAALPVALALAVGCAKAPAEAPSSAAAAAASAGADPAAEAPSAAAAAGPAAPPAPTPAPTAAGGDHGDHAGHGHHGDDKANCDEPAEAAVIDTPGAAAPAAAQPEGKVYGAGVSEVEVVQVSALLADVDRWVGKKVRVEGMVTDVCPMRGCWFELAGDKVGTSLRFKVRDGVMVFPLSAKGQIAAAEGVVRKIPLDLDASRRYMAHQAEEKGEAFDPQSVKEPITIVRLDGTGAVLRDAP
jgi:hypothetical protein